MMFVLRMALRETRASLRRLFFFFICIAVGVAAIVALRSVIQSVRGVFGTEAKSLIAADVLIATNRDWTAEARATIDRRLADAGAVERTEMIETPTMVRPADGAKAVAKMAELRAVQPRFPLYGSIDLQGTQSYSPALLAEPRRAGAARAADRDRGGGRRPDRHRPRHVHDSRADRARAGAGDGRVQPRPAGHHRLRRSRRRPACSGSAAAPAAPC